MHDDATCDGAGKPREVWTPGVIRAEFKGERVGPLPFDRGAVGGANVLYLLSVVGGQTVVKGLRAMLQKREKGVALELADARFRRVASSYGRIMGRVYVSGDGYEVYQHKLLYGQVHTLFLSRDPQFLPVVGEEALWRKLKEDRFTTPLLRQWMPYVETKLRDQNLLIDCYGFRCRCAELLASTGAIDEIVKRGMKSGDITIPDPPRRTAAG